MKRCLIANVKYGWYSKQYILMTVFSIMLVVGIQFMNYSAVMESYDSYLRNIEFYDGNIEAMEEDLNGEYELTVSEDGNSGVIENPLLYHKEMVKRYIYTATPKNAIAQIQEMTVIILPIIFGIFGAIYSTVDSKYKMNKIRKVRCSKIKYAMSKKISFYLSSVCLLLVTFVLGKISNLLIFNKIRNNIDIKTK